VHATTGDEIGGGFYSSAGAVQGFHTGLRQGGTATFLWEVIEANTAVLERAVLPLALSFTANSSNNLPTPGSATQGA